LADSFGGSRVELPDYVVTRKFVDKCDELKSQSQLHVTNKYRLCEVGTSCILNIGSKWREVVSLTFHPMDAAPDRSHLVTGQYEIPNSSRNEPEARNVAFLDLVSELSIRKLTSPGERKLKSKPRFRSVPGSPQHKINSLSGVLLCAVYLTGVNESDVGGR
jgi:hypothetical protein